MAVCFYLYHCYATISSSREHIQATKHAKTPQYIKITQALRYFQGKFVVKEHSENVCWSALRSPITSSILTMAFNSGKHVIEIMFSHFVFVQSVLKIPTYQSYTHCYTHFHWKSMHSTRHMKPIEECLVNDCFNVGNFECCIYFNTGKENPSYLNWSPLPTIPWWW